MKLTVWIFSVIDSEVELRAGGPSFSEATERDQESHVMIVCSLTEESLQNAL